MIPSTWFRRLILALAILEFAGAVMWLATRLVPNPADKAFAQTVAGMVFLLGFYACAPLSARFLAPKPSSNGPLLARLREIALALPARWPVTLYDHRDVNAITVGIIERHSRVYVTSGLMACVSDKGLKGILAHEETHVREHHILTTFTYACAYALLAHYVSSNKVFLLGFVGFMTLRRYLEYRADAGGAASAGREAMLTALHELKAVYKEQRWTRWLMFAMPYPSLSMRIAALQTGRRPLF
ncbi:MAG: M48 family metalloprotease [Betaproteobacteria bacterium]